MGRREKSSEVEKPEMRNAADMSIAAAPTLRPDGVEVLRSAQLEAKDLKDGLRLLVLQVTTVFDNK